MATGAGLGATGVARAGMEKNDQSPKQDENPTLEDSKPQGNKGKKLRQVRRLAQQQV